MSSFVNTCFTYNGISSDTMNVINCTVGDGGMLKQNFGVKRKTITDTGINNRIFTFGNEYENLVFSIELAKKDFTPFTESDRENLAQWLFPDEDYHPFVTQDLFDRVFYAKVVDESDFYNNGLNEGYVTLTFECDSFCPYVSESASKLYASGIINNPMITPLKFIPCKVEFVANSSTVSITNQSDSYHSGMIFIGLEVGETISMDVELGEITSSTGKYRYNDFNKKWIYLVKGENHISINGADSVIFRYNSPVMS